MEQFLEGSQAYLDAPVGTVVEDRVGIVVKVDGDRWRDVAGGWIYFSHTMAECRKVVHTFRLGETITAKTKPWLPPDAEVEDGFLIKFPGLGRVLYSQSDYDSAPVGTSVKTIEGGMLLTKTRRGWEPLNGRLIYDSSDLADWPRVLVEPVDRYAVGNTLYSKADYDNAPVGTTVGLIGGEEGFWVKTADGWRGPKGEKPTSGLPPHRRTILDPMPEWELDLLYGEAPEPVKPVDPRVDGERTVKYSHNKAKGTVYAYDGGFAHRDFGRIVKLSDSRFLAVPNRTPREFLTEQDAINYLL